MHMHDFFMKISKEMLEFLSPAADFVEKRMSLDEICIMWPHATYFMSAVGQVCSVGIQDGALLVIDSSVTPVIWKHDHCGCFRRACSAPTSTVSIPRFRIRGRAVRVWGSAGDLLTGR